MIMRAMMVTAVTTAPIGVSFAQTQIGSPSLVIISVTTNSPATCADFVKNDDGTWSNIDPLVINGHNVYGRLVIPPNKELNGLNIVAQLELNCRK